MRERVSPLKSTWVFAGECRDAVAAGLGLVGCLTGSLLAARVGSGVFAALLATLDVLGLLGGVRGVVFGALWRRFFAAFLLGAGVTVGAMYGICSWGAGQRADYRRIARAVGLLGGLATPYFLAGLVLAGLHWVVGPVFLVAGLAAFLLGCAEVCWAAGGEEVRAGWLLPVLVPAAGALAVWLALRLFPLRLW